MRVLFILSLCVLPHAAVAQDILFDLAGSWAGTGTYLDRNIKEDIRCRINVTSDNATTEITGVCASARRNEDVNFTISRNGDGSLRSLQENADNLRRPVELTGALEGDRLRLTGQQGAEETRLAMQLTAPDKMEMTIVITTEARTQSSTLLFTRR